MPKFQKFGAKSRAEYAVHVRTTTIYPSPTPRTVPYNSVGRCAKIGHVGACTGVFRCVRSLDRRPAPVAKRPRWAVVFVSLSVVYQSFNACSCGGLALVFLSGFDPQKWILYERVGGCGFGTMPRQDFEAPRTYAPPSPQDTPPRRTSNGWPSCRTYCSNLNTWPTP